MIRSIIAVIIGILVGLIFSVELHTIFFKMKVGPYGEYHEAVKQLDSNENKIQMTNPFSIVNNYTEFDSKSDILDMVEVVRKISIFNLFTIFIAYCISSALVASIIAKNKKWLIGLIVVLPVSVLPILNGTNNLILNGLISVLYLTIGVLIGFGVSFLKKKKK